MNKSVLIGVVLSLVFGLVAYVASNSIFVSLTVLLLTLIYFVIVIRKRFSQYEKRIADFYECFHFINNFIVSLSIKASVSSSYESTIKTCSEEIINIDYSIKGMTDNEKLIYLKRIFKFDFYQLFVDIVDMWCEEGGNILEMSNYLTNELREQEEYLSFVTIENKKKLVEFSVLWLFSLLILFILRFALNDFYSSICNQSFYPFAIGGFFLVILLSIELITREISNLQIGGNKYDKEA